MPVSKDPRPYDPAQDPGNPASSPPHWSVIAGMLITVLSAGVTALLGVYDILRTDPVKAILIAVGAMLAAGGTVVGVAVVQGRKERASIEGAADIRVAEAHRETIVIPPRGADPSVQP
jgi:F0F1-type ATP synthase membrane subunit c/vacuolar-type H+-ATPase subunit K